MRVKFILASCFIFFAGATAHADGFFDKPKVRFGFSGGQLDLSDSNYSPTAWNFMAGYEFNRYLAVEVGTLIDRGIKYPDPTGTLKVDTSSYHLTAVGSYPLGDIVSVYGRAGLLRWTLHQKYSTGGTTTSASDDGNDPYFGAGFAFNVDSGLLQFEYARTKIFDTTTTYISLGILWRVEL